jgi:hypothetical protein
MTADMLWALLLLLGAWSAALVGVWCALEARWARRALARAWTRPPREQAEAAGDQAEAAGDQAEAFAGALQERADGLRGRPDAPPARVEGMEELVQAAREQADALGELIEVLRAQKRNSIAPWLLATVVRPSAVRDVIDASFPEQREALLDGLAEVEDRLEWACIVTNVSEQVAAQVTAFLYDHSMRAYFGSTQGQEVLLPGESELFYFAGPATSSLDVVEDGVRQTYGAADAVVQALTEPGGNRLVVAAADVEGRVHAHVRDFGITETGRVHYAPSRRLVV